jgi:hypothetical protein
VFGAIAAFCLIGLFTDLLLKGRYFYNTMAFFEMLEILLLVSVLLSSATCTSIKDYSVSIQGLLMTSIQVLQLLVLPLEIAAKHRDAGSLRELPLAG